MNIEYVKDHTIFETIVGSQAYGTNNEESDQDEAGVMIPDPMYLYGIRSFEQFQEYETDKVVYSVQKVVQLITDNNPNLLDLLCAPDRCILYNTKYWQEIMDNKQLFISKKCKNTYIGYALGQLSRIRTHRGYLLNPPQSKPERNNYGLREYSIFESTQLKAILNIESVYDYVLPENRNEFLHELDVLYADSVIPIFKRYLNPDRSEISLAFIQNSLSAQIKTLTYLGQKNYIKEEYIEEAEKELRYQNDLSEWKKYQEWKKHRNKKRAAIEEKHGYDCKHAMHLTRLVRMGKEILQTGKVNVDRTNIDAEELKYIRNGGWTYDQIEEYVIKIRKEMEDLYITSSLQYEPRTEEINNLVVRVIDEYLRDRK